jgi:general stress protein 26
MTDKAEIEEKFWKSLHGDRTLMLSLVGVDEGHSQPMTAQTDDDIKGGKIWFFTSKDTDLADALGARHRAVGHFAAKDHDVFATLHGDLVVETDRAMLDKLWNKWAAAWFEGGKDDPKLLMLRLDIDEVQIWLNENSLFAGVKVLLGSDPKKDYGDKSAQLRYS